MSTYDVEKLEEEKLKAKYPGGLVGGNPGRTVSGHSAFLQKRLAKGVSSIQIKIFIHYSTLGINIEIDSTSKNFQNIKSILRNIIN